jgi:lipid-A-disaccharide synthase
MIRNEREIFCSAGELSGDLHAAALINEAKSLSPHLKFFGLGGQMMEKSGCELICDLKDTAVMGFTEIIGSLRRILSVRRHLSQAIIQRKPAAVVLIDSPDLNFHLAKVASQHNIPVIYYICPQIWAWREGRIKFLARYTSRRALIFPFEKKYYEDRGVSSDLVGHPLLDEIVLKPKGLLKDGLGLDREAPALAILPGSRLGMFRQLAPVMFQAVEKLLKLYPPLQPLLALSPIISQDDLVQALLPFPELKKSLIIPPAGSRDILRAADAALLASGTSVMEAAILGTPMIVAYKVSRISWFLAQALVKVPFAAAANLVAGRRVIPEYLQDDCIPEKLLEGLVPLLKNGPERSLALHELGKVSASLGGPGASKRVVQIISEEIGEE